MMRIGLIDVDGHNFPNLALMRISSYHKQKGDTVEWYYPLLGQFDIVYMSKVFSFTEDYDLPIYADAIIKGGTGYCIDIDGHGKEVFYKDKNVALDKEIESCYPDYSLYPEYDYCLSMTTRGCPRGCAFCHVAAKEGRCSKQVAEVQDFFRGEKKLIKVLDPNITACKNKRDLLMQYRQSNAIIDFTQGLDIRLLDDKDIDDINNMRIKEIHFAWDNPKENLVETFQQYSKLAKHKPHGHFGTVYCLTNFNSTLEEDLYRVYRLKELNFNPYIMIYDKEHLPRGHELKKLQRWVNNRFIFEKVPTFTEYLKSKI